jgi:hypothetical protein
MEINVARLKPLTIELRRIADALDRLLLEAYGVQMRPTPVPDKDESSIAYTSDPEMWKQELTDVGKYVDPTRPVDVEEFPE